MVNIVVALVGVLGGILLIRFRKEFATHCITRQNRLWGFRFGERTTRMTGRDPIYPEIRRKDYPRVSEVDWLDMMRTVVTQCRRILKPKGSAVLILQPFVISEQEYRRCDTVFPRYKEECGIGSGSSPPGQDGNGESFRIAGGGQWMPCP